MTTLEFFAYLKSFRNLEPAYRIVDHDGTDTFPDGRRASTGVTVRKGTQLLQVEGFATIRLPLSSSSMVTIPTYNRRQSEIVPLDVARAIGNDVACCLFGDLYLRKYGSAPVLLERTGCSSDGAKANNVVLVGCPVCASRMDGSKLGQHILRVHGDVAWRQYAQIYLERMWFGQGELDRRLVETFKNPVTCEMLAGLFSMYGVARNFLGNDTERYQGFVEMLNSYRDTEMTRDKVPGIIERELDNMNKIYGFNPLSATTKSFWMMKQHPIVIRDKYSCEGLKSRGFAPSDSYRSYFDCWFKFFDDPETQKGLDDALSRLPDSAAAQKIVKRGGEGKGEEVAAEIRWLADSQLMRNRVTDMRLFYEGGGFLADSLSCNFAG